MLRVPAIEHLEHREDAEDDRLAESGKESGDPHHDFDRDDKRQQAEPRRRRAEPAQKRNRTPRRAESKVVMIWRNEG